MLTVELLGPLRVSVAGRPVELPAGRLRALLAVLAVSAGRTVATERLSTAVWGADPPGDPRANVRTNVKRLRRALGDQLIEARPGGYLLAIDPDGVDALRFGRLLDAATAAAAATDLAAERRGLAAALALWRGSPFDGIGSDWLDRSVAPVLHERYLTAVERRVDLDLQRGVPTGAADVAELAELAGRHPLRESLWARLLRVLAATGRPAEALERYETIRRRLADDLGTDPSAELRRVHAALLAGADAALLAGADAALLAGADAALLAGADAAPGAASRERGVPRQLPAAVDGFAGREAALDALDALLDRPDRTRSPAPLVAVIAGTAGVGKTTLAVQWAHRVADRFPDGQLYVNLRGYEPAREALAPAAAIGEFLAALQVPPNRIPAGTAAQAALYRGLLAGRRVLVLLDNARDAAQVAPLLPAAPGCAVVVTSRDQLAGLVVTNGAHPVALDLLPPDQARGLLAARLGPGRLAAEPGAVADIVHACAGLPLALAIVAARAAIEPAHPLGDLAGELRDALGALNRAVDVRAIFSWSYRTLSDPAARLFRLVAGLHPGPDCTVDAAASLAGMPAAPAQPPLAAPSRPALPTAPAHAPLAELTRANLLTEATLGRYSCHDLLRAYAAELSVAHDPDREAARRRLVDHYAHTAHAAAEHLHGRIDTIAPPPPVAGVVVTRFAGPDDALAWFAADRGALSAVLALAADLRHDRQVCHLARTLLDVLHRQGRWHDRIDAQRVALAAAGRLGDPAAESRAHRNLAVALADLGRFDDAHHHLDAALDRSHDDLAGQAWTHYNRDIVYAVEGREADALDAARRAHELFDRLGDDVGEAIALTDMGWHHGRLGNHGPALDLLEQALVLHQKLGNRAYEAHALSCLADIRLRVDDRAGAIPRYRQSLELFRALGDRYAEASLLAHLGACHHLAGDHAAAGDEWRNARVLLDDLDPSTVDQIHTQLSLVDGPVADAFRQRVTPRSG